MKFGNYIKKERLEKSVLQRELAADLGIDTAYISKIENNEKLPKKELALEIGRTLSMDLEKLETYWLKQKLLNNIKGEKYSLKALKLILEELKKESE